MEVNGMVFELFDVGIIMAAAVIIVAGLFFAARRVGDELFILNELLKNGVMGNSAKQRDDEYAKKMEELKRQFPEKFPGLVPTDPTQKP
jgi:hypothetical protein